MTFADTLRFAVRSLFMHRTRMALTILGVAIGTASVALMMSIGWSNYRQFASLLESNPNLTQIEVRSAVQTNRAGLTDNDVNVFAQIENVQAVSPVIELPCVVTTGQYEAAGFVLGVNPEAYGFTFQEGDVFSPDSALPQIVLGSAAPRSFADPAAMPENNELGYVPPIDWMDAPLRLQVGSAAADMPAGRIYRAAVAGVLAADSGGDALAMYISPAAAQEIMRENRDLLRTLGVSTRGYSSAVVRAQSMDDVPAIAEEIRALGFEAWSESEYIMQMREEQVRQQLQLLAIGVTSLVVAAIGIVNIMYACVLEQKRQIGILKVLGTSAREIRRIYLLEACIVGAAGGLIGLAACLAAILAINASAQPSLFGLLQAGGTHISVPAPVAAGAFLLGIGAAVGAGLWPAHRATQLSVLSAVQRED